MPCVQSRAPRAAGSPPDAREGAEQTPRRYGKSAEAGLLAGRADRWTAYVTGRACRPDGRGGPGPSSARRESKLSDHHSYGPSLPAASSAREPANMLNIP